MVVLGALPVRPTCASASSTTLLHIFCSAPMSTSTSTSPPPERRSPPTDEERAAWRQHTEESPPLCLAYVKEHATPGDAQSVVDAIDAFCTKRRMMNVGPTKGAIVDAQIRRKKPTIMAELGSYSGYSAVRFASLQREVAGPDSHYYAFEYSPQFAEIVREMVAFAGLANQVTIFVGPFADNYEQLKGKTVDIYFIDHEKSVYLQDAQLILASGTLQKGSILAADNVLMPGAPDYIAFLQSHAQFVNTMNEVAMGRGVDAVMVSEFQG